MYLKEKFGIGGEGESVRTHVILSLNRDELAAIVEFGKLIHDNKSAHFLSTNHKDQDYHTLTIEVK